MKTDFPQADLSMYNSIHKRIKSYMKTFEKTDPEFSRIITDFVYDEAMKHNPLDQTELYMCILAGLIGIQGKSMFQITVERALDDEVNPIIIKEVIYQATAYLGIGRTYDYLNAANEVFVRKNIELPLKPQGTTDQETRLQAGIDKQCELFGDHMRNVLPSSAPLRKTINTWLADNCFGDYYTRKGLTNAQREMITFCFLAAQGGCEPQLRSHTSANFRNGNNKEKMYAVTEAIMPYIGYPRTLNAMNAIDEVAEKEGR